MMDNSGTANGYRLSWCLDPNLTPESAQVAVSDNCDTGSSTQVFLTLATTLSSCIVQGCTLGCDTFCSGGFCYPNSYCTKVTYGLVFPSDGATTSLTVLSTGTVYNSDPYNLLYQPLPIQKCNAIPPLSKKRRSSREVRQLPRRQDMITRPGYREGADRPGGEISVWVEDPWAMTAPGEYIGPVYGNSTILLRWRGFYEMGAEGVRLSLYQPELGNVITLVVPAHLNRCPLAMNRRMVPLPSAGNFVHAVGVAMADLAGPIETDSTLAAVSEPFYIL